MKHLGGVQLVLIGVNLCESSSLFHNVIFT